MNVNFGAVNGTMINCFGTVSPWGTPLTSEENYEAENTVRWNDATYSTGYPNYADVKLIQAYLGGTYPQSLRLWLHRRDQRSEISHSGARQALWQWAVRRTKTRSSCPT
jgi:hypothetical protein